MLDITCETPLPLADAVHLIPASRGARKAHVSTLLRWINRGVGGIKLEAVRLGGRWVTTAGAIQRFSEALTLAKGVTATPLPSRAVSVARAQKTLATAGF